MLTVYPDRFRRDLAVAVANAPTGGKRAAGYGVVVPRYPAGSTFRLVRAGVVVFECTTTSPPVVTDNKLRLSKVYGAATVLMAADIATGAWTWQLISGDSLIQGSVGPSVAPYILSGSLSPSNGFAFGDVFLTLPDALDPSGGSGGATTTAENLIADMGDYADEPLKGETAFWAFRSVNYMANKPVRWNTPTWWNRNLVPNDDWWKSIIPWVVLFEGSTNTRWDARFNVASLKLYQRRAGVWTLLAEGNGLGGNLQPKGGGYYGGGAGAATWQTEADGTRSLGLQNPYNWHGYLGVNPLQYPGEIEAIHVRLRARMIGSGAAAARWLVHIGADYYPQYSDPGFIVPAVAISRPRLLTTQWQDFSMTTLSDVGHQEPGGGITAQQLRRNPPPLA